MTFLVVVVSIHFNHWMTNFSSMTIFTFALWWRLQCGGVLCAYAHCAHWIIQPWIAEKAEKVEKFVNCISDLSSRQNYVTNNVSISLSSWYMHLTTSEASQLRRRGLDSSPPNRLHPSYTAPSWRHTESDDSDHCNVQHTAGIIM